MQLFFFPFLTLRLYLESIHRIIQQPNQNETHIPVQKPNTNTRQKIIFNHKSNF